MRNQGLDYFRSNRKIWSFLIGLEDKGWKFSKTQYILEKKKILDSKISSDELISQTYRLDEEKYLRYDLTIPWKNYLEQKTNQPKLLKRYELGEVFRKGPRKGRRYRNFTQLDLEICSKTNYQTEELLRDFSELFQNLLPRILLKYNNYSYLKELSFLEKQQIDKHFSKNKPIDPKVLAKYTSIISKIIDKPSLKTCFTSVYTPSLMRGQGIYEEEVFEGYFDNEKYSLFGGGTYKVGEYFCTGISIGIDFLCDLID